MTAVTPDNPKMFSVILPTFNRATFLKTAIESVMAQIFQDWELIVVDDGSTDNSREIVYSFEDGRIHYHFQENSERSTARNNGIALARGKYICFLDSDDYYTPGHLDAFYKVISSNDEPVAMLVSGVYDEHSGIRMEKATFHHNYDKNPFMYFWENTVLTPISVCIHKKILEIHKFIPEFNIWEDTHLWLRILCEYPFYYVDNFTAVCVRHEDSGVVKDLAEVKVEKVEKYISAIRHLFNNYPIVKKYIDTKMIGDYIDKKYQMFIYQARVNRQFEVAFELAKKAISNKFSLKNMMVFLKLIGHKMSN